MSVPVNTVVLCDSHLSAEPPPANLNSHDVLHCPPCTHVRRHAGSGAALRDEAVGLAAAFLCNSALGRQEVMPVRNKSDAWRPGCCSAARKIPPEC